MSLVHPDLDPNDGFMPMTVPEPSTLLLLGFGVVALFRMERRAT